MRVIDQRLVNAHDMAGQVAAAAREPLYGNARKRALDLISVTQYRARCARQFALEHGERHLRADAKSVTVDFTDATAPSQSAPMAASGWWRAHR